jgi:HK97 gp10 family phage protein
MEINIDVSQIKVLEDFFQGLSTIDQTKIFMSGFRKAAKPLVDMAKADAPNRTGKLMNSFGTIEMPQNVSIMVGAKLNKGWVGHLVENGTMERFRKTKKMAPTGKLTGQHFFENAFNMVEEGMYDKMAEEWYNAIDRFIIKTNKLKK